MNDEEFELLRENFLRGENGLISYLKNGSGDVDKIKDVLQSLRKIPTDDLKRIAIEKFENVECGNIKEKDLERVECELSLLLMCVPPNVEVQKEYWNKKLDEIKDLNRTENGKVLIEIGAQHPLINGKPGEEFAARLDKGIKLYNKEIEKGNEAYIYVPGSVHSIYDKTQKQWETDSNSLSKAGFDYLVEHGIPIESVKSEEANNKYMKKGVYNSGDEVFVSACVAKDEECSRVISVNSPVQLYRKALFYIENGYIPEIYSVPLSNTYHNYVGELFWSLYITAMEDHTWQDGFLAEKTREERNVNFHDEVQNEPDEERQKIYQILKDGLNLPQSIYEKKAEWTSMYQKAKSNMDQRAEEPNILIEADFTLENFDEGLDILCEAIEKAGDKKCIIHKNDSIDLKMPEIESRLEPLLKNGAQIDVLDYAGKTTTDVYNDEHCSDLFIVCSSDKTIRKAIDNVKDGIVPQVFAVPSKRDDFIKEIFEMYEGIIKEEKNKDIEEKENANTILNDVDWGKIMEYDER